MAKTTGLGDNFYVGGYDLSGDIGAVQVISGSKILLEVTGLDKSAIERIGSLRDGKMEFSNWYNFAAGQEHPVLSALPTADVQCSYFRGTTQGNPAASMIGKQVDYDLDRATDGSVKGKVRVDGNGYGLEWGVQQTAGKQTDASAASGTGLDYAAASAFGLQAYLHVFTIGSGAPSLKLQESSDNGAGDAFTDVTGGSFGALTANTTYRIATTTSLAVERYLRTVSTGVFTNLVFALVVVRNSLTPTF